ncbi:tudor domain-containing protein 1-like isoform X2 [Battus philenor]|uniref:tudor domain-containing protein 1-like isoform X2 n=1 Tax=Battus philenor TaxID=42288 RepID=UPI0035CF8015
MSYMDLATVAMHRRTELETRINNFMEKCDQAVNGIKNLEMLAQTFIDELDCDPAELKDKFLNCMKKLDEFTYIITDFNLAVNKFESNSSSEYTPVHEKSARALPSCDPFNLIDALSEPTPSTSKACFNQCPPDKPTCRKVSKQDQPLIAFSSTSSSINSVPDLQNTTGENSTKSKIVDNVNKSPIENKVSEFETHNLPAQTVLQLDQEYPASILNVDGCSFWVITETPCLISDMIRDMTEFYRSNHVVLTPKQVSTLTYCATYVEDRDCFYRGFLIRLCEEERYMAEVFLVDTGEVQVTNINNIKPLEKRFCVRPPYARCCHLAGIDLNENQNPDKLEMYLKQFIGTPCTIEVHDNTSESLGVYVILQSRKILNIILIENGLALGIENLNIEDCPGKAIRHSPPEITKSNLNINDCPEHEDPVEAVTGYHNRDEADICKHYKGEPEGTCFKGARCNKKHILKHPDGWTLDRVAVVGKCPATPLPAPGTWMPVHVTHVAHYDRLYVQLVKPERNVELPKFGVVLPPMTLKNLVRDMNSPAARVSYKRLKMTPAPGELVAAQYPLDNQWYRARVLSATRADQSVEVMYIDYGNVLWVKEDAVSELDPRYWALEAQAVRCVLAGVRARTSCSRMWAAARKHLESLAGDRTLGACVVSRDYDEITVELYDDNGVSIAEELAASQLVELTEYTIEDDTAVKQKLVVP